MRMRQEREVESSSNSCARKSVWKTQQQKVMRQDNVMESLVIEVFYPHGENANTFRKEIQIFFEEK